MSNTDIERLTINQFNIAGKRNDISIEQLKQYTQLKEIIIRNFYINDNFINVLNTMNLLENIKFVNCIFNNNIKMKNINKLSLQNCKNLNLILNIEKVKSLIITDGESIDINMIKNIDLEMLRLENVKVLNLKCIENFTNIEYLYLQKIDLDESIDYGKLSKLKELNLDGSIVKDRDEYINRLKKLNVQFSFKKDNLKID